jgi:hypothetical protein
MLSLPGPGLKGLVVLFLCCAMPSAAFGHSYQVCFAKHVQICKDFFPPSWYTECVIGAIGSCGTHTHGGGGFTPVEFPFGSRSFPGLDAMLNDDSISAEHKAMAREAREAHRLAEEARTREFNLILRATTLTDGGETPCEQPEAQKK